MSTTGKRPVVFICHSSTDRGWAERVCDALESRGLRCWIAPRDIPPGTEYGDAIIDGIDACPAFVFILSAQADDSPHVRRELERAVSQRRRLFPCRVGDVTPTGAVLYAIGNTQWLDLHGGDADDRLRELADRIAETLGVESADQPVRPTERKRRRTVLTRVLGLLAVGVVVAAAVYFLPSADSRENGDPPRKAVDPAERRAEEVRTLIRENADRLKRAYQDNSLVKSDSMKLDIRSVKPSADGTVVVLQLEYRVPSANNRTGTPEVTLVVGDKGIVRLTLSGETMMPKMKSGFKQDALRDAWSAVLFP